MRLPRLGVGPGDRRLATRALVIGLILGLLVPPRSTDPPAVAPSSMPRQTATASVFARLPLSFEANFGQTDPRVKFLARGPGYTLFLTPTEAVLALSSARLGRDSSTPGAVLRMTFAGTSPQPSLAALEPLPGRINYFIGSNPRMWRTDIPTNARVKYAELYPGIDLVYHGDQGQLEYDVVVAPGADPSAIVVAYAGTRSLRVDAQGDLILHLPGGQIRQRKPRAFQERDGVRQEIASRYVLRGASEVGVEVGRTNPHRPGAVVLHVPGRQRGRDGVRCRRRLDRQPVCDRDNQLAELPYHGRLV